MEDFIIGDDVATPYVAYAEFQLIDYCCGSETKYFGPPFWMFYTKLTWD